MITKLHGHGQELEKMITFIIRTDLIVWKHIYKKEKNLKKFKREEEFCVHNPHQPVIIILQNLVVSFLPEGH